MTATTVAAPPQTTAGLRQPLTFALLASLVASFLASSSAPTPIYAIYQHRFGMTPITITIVFGIYALAVLVALLTFGKLSDHIGRKPVLIVTVLAQIVAMIVFTNATGLSSMLTARVIQGLCTGGAFGAFGAGMMDIYRAKGTLANAVAPACGTAFGAIGSAVVVQFLPSPTHFIYLIFIGVYALQLAGVLAMRETVSRRPGALASLRPEFALPRAVRRAAITAAPVLFAVWSLAGFYGSLGPSLARTLDGSTSAVPDALPLFTLAFVAALAVVALRNVSAERMFGIGIVTLVVGLVITLVSLDFSSEAAAVTGFYIGTIIAGVGFGSGFQGGLRTVLPLAEAHERAGVLSVLYCACYIGFGGPAVIAGFLVVHQGGPVVVAREYGLVLATIASLAGIGLLLDVARQRGKQGVASQPTPLRAPSPVSTPDFGKLELQLTAETDAKLAAARALRDAYTRLLSHRAEFAARDAANVAVARHARAAAVRAGFAESTLNRLGFGAITESAGRRAAPTTAGDGSVATAAPAAGARPGSVPDGFAAQVGRMRNSIGSDATLSQTLDMLNGVTNPDLRDGLATDTALRALGFTPGAQERRGSHSHNAN